MSISLLSFIFFFLFLIIGIPIPVSMGLASITSILLIGGDYPLSVISTLIFGGLDSFVLIAVPFFMLTGLLMELGGTSKRIFDFSESIVGWMKGSMGAVNIVASFIFGGISGSSSADVAGLGPVEIEAMTRVGYPKAYASAVTVVSSLLAMVVPPSIPLILYAIIAEQSVGAMLLAGIIPGALLALSMIIINYYLARKNGWGATQPLDLKNIYQKGKYGLMALISPFIILGGIFGGYFTPTEAGAIAVLYTFLIGYFVFRELELKALPKTILTMTSRTGSALLILGCSTLFQNMLASEQIPQKIAGFLLSISTSTSLLLFLISIFVLMAGMFLDNIFVLIVFSSLFLPTMKTLGIDPVHFGIVMTVSSAIGALTPPVGGCLFIVCVISGLPMEKVVKEMVPFLIMLSVALFVVVFFPQFSTLLPRLFYGR